MCTVGSSSSGANSLDITIGGKLRCSSTLASNGRRELSSTMPSICLVIMRLRKVFSCWFWCAQSPISTRYPCSAAVTSMPRITSLKNGSQISGTITRMVRDSLRLTLRPIDWGKYPTSSAACSTLLRVDCETLSGFINARDTVAVETFAFRATSFIVAAATCLFGFTLSPRQRAAGTDSSLNSLHLKHFYQIVNGSGYRIFIKSVMDI